MTRRIVLVENQPPQFDGAWKVVEVLQMAQALAAWVEQLQVSSDKPAPEAPPQPAAKENETWNN